MPIRAGGNVFNVPAGETETSVKSRKQDQAISAGGSVGKIGLQGAAGGIKLGGSILKKKKKKPIEAGGEVDEYAYMRTPKYKNFADRPGYEKVKMFDVNDIYSSLKEQFDYYDLGKVVHPGLFLGSVFSPAISAASIPFLFQGENFRNKLKELSAKYQPEHLLENVFSTAKLVKDPGKFLGSQIGNRLVDAPGVSDLIKSGQRTVLRMAKVPAQLLKESAETSDNIPNPLFPAFKTSWKLPFGKSAEQKKGEEYWKQKADKFITETNKIVESEQLKYDSPTVGLFGEAASTIVAAVGTTLLTKSPAAASTLFGAMAKGQGYETARANKISPTKASNFSTVQGIFEGGLEAVGLHNLIKPAYGLRGVVKKMAQEALQEASQTTAEASIQAAGGYENRNLDQVVNDVILSAGIGAVMGGVVGGSLDLVRQKSVVNAVHNSIKADGGTKADAQAIVKIIPKVEQMLTGGKKGLFSIAGGAEDTKALPSKGQQKKVLTPQEKLAKAIRSEFPKVKKLRAEQEVLYTEARGKAIQKATAAYKKAGGGESGLNAWLKAMQGELPKKTFVSLRDKFNQEELDNLINIAAKHPELDKFKQKATAQAIRELITQGKVPGKAMLATFDDIYGRDISKAIRTQASIGKKIGHFIGEVARTSRTFMTIGEASMVARQNLIATVSHPLVAARAVPGTFKSLAKKGYKAEVEKIKKMSTYELMKKFKVPLTAVEGSTSKQEEPFQSFWAEKTPIIGKYLVKPFERIFTTYGNIMKAKIFDKEATNLLKQGYKPTKDAQVFKDLSEIIGIETGRSSLPKGLEKHADLLNTGFFAARLQMSRIKAINPYTYVRLHPAVRKILLKDVLITLAVGIAALWGMKKKGYKVETDPRSSDFGKTKVGNTRIDIWGGHGQYVRLIYQLASGEIKSVNSGVVRLLGKKGGDNRADVILRFLRGKVSPGISAAWDALAGTTVVGEEVTPQQQAASKFLPIFWQDLYEAYKSTGEADKTILTTGLPGFFGVGSQTYEPKISDYSEDVKDNRVNWYESKDSIELFKTMPGGEDFYNITSTYKDQYKKYKDGKADAPDKEVYRNLVETVLNKAIIPQAKGENKENWEALLEIHKAMNDGKMEWNAYRKLVTKLREGDKVIASYPSSIWN